MACTLAPMRITVLSGGVGGARFLTGLREVVDADTDTITVIGNTADDIWLFGLRVCPDLDTVMYTLGDGIDVERGWGRRDETWLAKEELAAYGVEPSWFGLGDRDIATHLVRTQMLNAGFTLSAVTQALCARWKPGVDLLPMTDDRVETHVVIDDPEAEGGRRAVHFQEYWVRLHAPEGVRRPAGRGRRVAAGARRDRGHHRRGPRHPAAVEPGGVDRHDPRGTGDRRRAAGHSRPRVVGVSPIISGCPGARDGRPTAPGDRGRRDRRGRRCALRARSEGGLLDGWLVDSADADAVPALERVHLRTRAVPLLMTRPRGDAGDRDGRPRPRSPRRRHDRVTDPDDAATATLRAVAWPEIGPGDDLVALVAAIDDLRDGDVVLVTSKVVSKAEGRLVDDDRQAAIAERDPPGGRPAWPDGHRRDAARPGHGRRRRRRVEHPARHRADRCRSTPTAPRARLRAGCARRHRPQRRRGAHRHRRAGLATRADRPGGRVRRAARRCVDLAGTQDTHGNTLLVTAPAVADELAAAADLVKGKTSGRPVAVVRGLAAARPPAGRARARSRGAGATGRARTCSAWARARPSWRPSCARTPTALAHFPTWSPADSDPFDGLLDGLARPTGSAAARRRSSSAATPAPPASHAADLDAAGRRLGRAPSPATLMAVGRLLERADDPRRRGPDCASHTPPRTLGRDAPGSRPVARICWQDR